MGEVSKRQLTYVLTSFPSVSAIIRYLPNILIICPDEAVGVEIFACVADFQAKGKNVVKLMIKAECWMKKSLCIGANVTIDIYVYYNLSKIYYLGEDFYEKRK